MLLMLASRVLLMLAPGVLLLQGHLQFLDSIDMWSLVGAAQFFSVGLALDCLAYCGD